MIGNAAYPGAGALKNPANDATDIGAKLKKLGFDVTVRTDIRHKDMLRSLTEFGDKVQSGTEALFFYAGHGMQVKGKNYLTARISPGGLFFCVAAATGGNGIPGCPALLLEGVTQNNRFLTIRAG